MISNRITAIPTTYKGIKFRSKLEASWAEWFDAQGIAWTYETEGYQLPSGTWYLPDFWLPENRTFFEVKGLLDDSINKPIELAKAVTDIKVVVGSSPVGNFSLIKPDGTLDSKIKMSDIKIATTKSQVLCNNFTKPPRRGFEGERCNRPTLYTIKEDGWEGSVCEYHVLRTVAAGLSKVHINNTSDQLILINGKVWDRAFSKPVCSLLKMVWENDALELEYRHDFMTTEWMPSDPRDRDNWIDYGTGENYPGTFPLIKGSKASIIVVGPTITSAVAWVIRTNKDDSDPETHILFDREVEGSLLKPITWGWPKDWRWTLTPFLIAPIIIGKHIVWGELGELLQSTSVEMQNGVLHFADSLLPKLAYSENVPYSLRPPRAPNKPSKVFESLNLPKKPGIVGGVYIDPAHAQSQLEETKKPK